MHTYVRRVGMLCLCVIYSTANSKDHGVYRTDAWPAPPRTEYSRAMWVVESWWDTEKEACG